MFKILSILLLLVFSTSGVMAQAPQITQPPVGQTVIEGQNAQFTVVATGSNLVYQWLKDGVPLVDSGRTGGALTATLTITGAQQSDAGSFSVVVSVSGSPNLKVSSDGVLLKVDPPTPPVPQITQQPTGQTVTEGQNAQFTVVATGANLVYQWAKDGVALVDGGRISGTSTAALSITGVLKADEGSYSVVVTVSGYPQLKASSNGALLKVDLPTPPAPQITQQPAGQIATEGQSAQFTVMATGSNLVYQWAKDGVALSDGGRISGSGGAALTITAVQATDGGSYSVVVSVSGYPELKAGSDGALLIFAPSTNANLANLAISVTSLNPAFASGTTGYTASVSNSTASITVTPTLAGSTASVTVNGIAVVSGNASAPINLATGSNTINVVVTAHDGTTQKGYTVVVTRQTYYATWSAAHNLIGVGSGLAEDFDHDGRTNFEEMAFGTDPTVASGGVITLSGTGISQRGSVTTWVESIVNGVNFRALFGRRKDYVAAGLTYTVQFSGDMVSWEDSVATPTPVASDAEMDAVTVPYPFFVNGRKSRFFRVQVSSP